MRALLCAVLALAVFAGCRQDAPQAQPTPAPTVRPIAVPPFRYTPTPVLVPTPTPTPPPDTAVGSVAVAPGLSFGAGIIVTPTPIDPPPVGGNSNGNIVGNGSNGSITTAAPTPSPTPTAAPSVTPSPTIASKHVQAIIYGQNSPNSGSPYTEASPGPWAQYVSWVWSPLFNWQTAMQAAGLKMIVYDNPMEPSDHATTGPCSASTSTVYDCTLLRSGGSYNSVAAKDSGGSIVTSYSGLGLVADPTQSQFASYWAADLANLCASMRSHTSTPVDLIFVDNNAGPLAGGFSATPATWNATNWGQAFATGATSLGTLPSCYSNDQVVTNTFGLGDDIQSTLVNAYLNSSAIVGGMYEGCQTGGYGWFATEDSAILAVAFLKAHSHPANTVGWWCYVDEQTLDGAANTQARMYVFTSYLMTYDLAYTSFSESFKSPPSNIPIFPETQFVPLGPTLSATNPIISSALCVSTCTTSGYSVTNGVFVQYFTNGCYFAGTKVSDSCEIAVNPTGSTNWGTGAVTGGTTQTIPNPNGYAHQMTVTGYGTMDGGSVSFSAPSTTSLPPQSGEILVP